ncbi:MAG TPA: hypothetical protein VIG99_17650 [Myxococcaceae bacterium]
MGRREQFAWINALGQPVEALAEARKPRLEGEGLDEALEMDFRVEGHTVVTRPPGTNADAKTHYELDGSLTLEYGGQESRSVKASEPYGSARSCGPATASRSASFLSVRSQVNSFSLRPKCP